ncbi:predicted protein [Postia placenta Mad-698-R]|uniref:Protein kinase domain-containing protein n=1 Tax=Postia placenta MAD-698-R-SB12 TaxID=670580 RepID=A0A1X6MUC2_9APHY|nr:hypothetical protein POSPLADRAFT_1148977 [Postia placenta MAD-698-R-SB12]EED86080.1 predicted protein [Postia placenta Mad-698-R]OSX59826.1 hypothetical protein POSPLADRAFT_1148977 [Postia placenta MAD-698-R-SB12]
MFIVRELNDANVTGTPAPARGPPTTTLSHTEGGLGIAEFYWRDHQLWLQKCGYMLRPRYKPDWVPSWLGTKKHLFGCEDGFMSQNIGRCYGIGVAQESLHPHEADIGSYFCSNELSSDPDNHCVPLYDVLKDPLEEDIVILVMPLLRKCNVPEFGTIGEVVEFIRQLVNGLRFMHVHHVAHRDMNRDFTGTARHYSRTERPTKYYYVDFGLSRKYSPDEYPPRELPILGGDKSVPEFQGEGYDEAVDPFPTDIYYLGNLIRMAFTMRYANFCFMDALIADMVQNDPQKRPHIEEVSSRFIEATSKLSARILRGRLVERDEPPVIRFLFGLGHLFRTAKTFTEANICQIPYVDCAMNKFTTHRSRLPSLGRTTTVLGSNDFSSLGATPVCCIECTRRDVLIATPIGRVESTGGDIFLPAPVRCVKRTSRDVLGTTLDFPDVCTILCRAGYGSA